MGSLSRISSQVYKNLLLLRIPWRYFDLLVWPVINFISFTFLAKYYGTSEAAIPAVILGMIGWRFIATTAMDIFHNGMDEYYCHSLPSLMAAPVHVFELVAGAAVTGFIKSIIVFAIFCALGWWLFGFGISDWTGSIAAFALLTYFGVVLGTFAFGLVLLARRSALPMAFALTDVFPIFTGALYPIGVLPDVLQRIAWLFPTTYAFEALRATLGVGSVGPPLAAIAQLAAFTVIAALFLLWAYDHARRKGDLARLG